MIMENGFDEVEVIQVEPSGKQKVRVHFGNGSVCQLYRGEAARLHVKEHTYLSGEQYRVLMTEILGKRAKKRAMHLLEQMDRTEQQLRQKLTQGDYPPECIEEAVAYVRRFGYLDDYRYACNFIRCYQEKKSRGQLLQKLMQKGIRRETAEQAMEEEYQSDEAAKIRALLAKRRFEPEYADRNEFQKTYQFLMRRGFKSSDVLKEMRCESYTIYSGL